MQNERHRPGPRNSLAEPGHGQEVGLQQGAHGPCHVTDAVRRDQRPSAAIRLRRPAPLAWLAGGGVGDGCRLGAELEWKIRIVTGVWLAARLTRVPEVGCNACRAGTRAAVVLHESAAAFEAAGGVLARLLRCERKRDNAGGHKDGTYARGSLS